MNLTPRYHPTTQKNITRNQKPILRSRNGSHGSYFEKSCLPNLHVGHDEYSLILPLNEILLPSNVRSQSNTNRRGTKDQIFKKNLRDIRLLLPLTTINCENLTINKVPNSQILSRRQISIQKKRPVIQINEVPKTQKSLSPLKPNIPRSSKAETIEVSCARDVKTIDYILKDLDENCCSRPKTRFKTPVRIVKNKKEINSRSNENDFGLISARERRDSGRNVDIFKLEKNYFKSSPVSLLNIDDETPCFGVPSSKLGLNIIQSKKPSHGKIKLDLNLKIKKNILTPKIASLNHIESTRRSDLSIDEYLIIHEYEQNKARLREFAERFRRKIFENTLRLPKRKIQISPLLRLKLLNRKQPGKLYG